MTKEEVIKALRIHESPSHSCSECPLNAIPLCFTCLVDETIKLLEGDNEHENL